MAARRRSAATRRGRRSGGQPEDRTRPPRPPRSDRPSPGPREWRARSRRWVQGERRALQAHGGPGNPRRWCRRSRSKRCASRGGAARRRRPSRRGRHRRPRSADEPEVGRVVLPAGVRRRCQQQQGEQRERGGHDHSRPQLERRRGSDWILSGAHRPILGQCRKPPASVAPVTHIEERMLVNAYLLVTTRQAPESRTGLIGEASSRPGPAGRAMLPRAWNPRRDHLSDRGGRALGESCAQPRCFG